MQEIVDEGDYDDEEGDKELIEEDIDDIVKYYQKHSFLAPSNEFELNTNRKKLEKNYLIF